MGTSDSVPNTRPHNLVSQNGRPEGRHVLVAGGVALLVGRDESRTRVPVHDGKGTGAQPLSCLIEGIAVAWLGPGRQGSWHADQSCLVNLAPQKTLMIHPSLSARLYF